MAPVLASAPPGPVAPKAPAISKRGRPKRKRTSHQAIFKGKKKKIQGNPTPVKHASAKGVRSKAKEASKPDSLSRDKVVSEKEMCLAIKSLFLQNFLNAKMTEWWKI